LAVKNQTIEKLVSADQLGSPSENKPDW